MDSSNWRPTQPEPAMEGAAGGGDWRTQLSPESRQRIVNKIMEILKRHLPCSGQEGLQELKKIAIRFEEKIYSAATSQSDYLRKISLKMLTMESKSQNPMPNALPPNSSGMSRNPQDSAPQNMQSQVQNQVQSLGMPMAPTQSQVQGHQQLLAHNMQNNISSAGMQNSSTLSSTLPPVSGLTQNSMPNVAQNSNIQNIAGITQNSIGNSMGQGSASSVYTNVQRQMQGRQHAPQGGTQQQSQQSQSQQQYMYQQQLQQQRMKQKLHPGNMQQPLLQPHIQQLQQQQNLLQPAQLQSPQQSVMQTSTVMQPPMVPSLQQNQQASIQQQPQSVYQQHQQSSSRQQQQSQQAPVHQQPNQMSQQPMIQMQQQPLPPQQQILGQQPNAANVQQSPLMGQQNSIPDMQQQRLLGQLTNLPSQQHNNHQNLQQQQSTGQQNNLSNMHQQQLGHQSQQLSGAQSGNSVMQTSQHPTPIVQQSKVVGHQQTQSSSGMVPGGGQQPQQQLMTQIQSQPTQLQQPLGHQQQSNLQHNMQQRLQTPNSLLQQQNIIDQQKQMFQSQRGLSEAPSTSLDSTAQTSGAGDCQEEVYQKIKTMKDMYFADLNEFYQKISMKLQQVDSHPQQPKMENLDKLRLFKQSLERMMHFLQLTKSSNLSPHKDRLALIEKQIVGFITSNRPRRPVSSLQQGQLPPPHQSMQHMQPPHPQASQAMPHETGLNSQVQSLSSQGPGSIVPSLQQGSVPAISGITSSQQNMISSMQSTASLDPLQGNAMGSKQQAAMGSLQQNPVGASQQASINSLPAQSGNLLHSNVSSLQSNSNMFQQHKQHEQHIMQTQQLKQQFQQRQIQQQLFQKQQQQQHQHPQLQQIKQQQLQQPGQMQSHQNSQLHPMNDVNDIKVKPGISLKSGVFQQHLLQGQRYSHQQLKPGASFPISSPQVISSVCPQINQHSSPHIDQQNLLPSMTKVGTPSQSANSPFPSPSTPLAPSPMPGDYEKFNSSGAPLSSAANISHQQTTAIPTSASSLAIGTPGISASPLLAEFTVPDGNIANTLAVTSGKSGIIEQPIERLLKAMKSISSKSLGAAVSDIGSVVNVMDRIAGSAPGNGSRATVGEDLVAMTKCRLQARSFITQDGSNGTKKMRRYTSAMPLNFVSSAGSVNDNCLQLTGSETAELESTATSNVKRPKVEANPSLLEEIREINERLIDTVVAISGEDIDPTITAVVAKGGEGTIVKCSYIAVALSPDFKVLYASRQMSQIQPLRLLVPANYPNCSPILLDKFPVEVSKEVEDLSAKAKSRFSISLRALSQPMSIKDIARTWDACTRAVMCEYAEKRGGGTFSSKYGGWEDVSSWEDVLTAA